MCTLIFEFNQCLYLMISRNPTMVLIRVLLIKHTECIGIVTFYPSCLRNFWAFL